MSETRIKYDAGKVAITCDSNSFWSFMGIAGAVLTTLQSELEKFDESSLSPQDREFLSYLMEEVESMSNHISHVENQADNVESPTDLAFYYKVLP